MSGHDADAPRIDDDDRRARPTTGSSAELQRDGRKLLTSELNTGERGGEHEAELWGGWR